MGIGVDVPELVSTIKHRACVSVVGEVEDIVPYIDAADFLILPSDKPEPFGLVLLEAFARGRAVIASDAGGVLDVVTDGTDGWLYPIGSASGLAAVLKSLDRKVAQEMGRSARLTYDERFSIGAYRGRFQQLWESLITDGNGSECAQS
jgi:glycosyltransferase involved in cell wall biosynthesis